jgi:hypothetical protein
MVRKTRKTPTKTKQAETTKALTIPELRKAFEHIDAVVHTKISKLEEEEAISAFRKEWKKIFGKEVSEESAKEYLQFVLSEKRSSGSAAAKQSGGAAPLGWDMTPGAGAVRALPYISDGFGFANKDSIVAECGKVDITPQLLPGMGDRTVKFGGGAKKKRETRRKSKKQTGGAIGSAVMEAITRPFFPTGAGYDAMLISKGINTLSSPRPEIPAFSANQPTTVYSASSTPTSRTF